VAGKDLLTLSEVARQAGVSMATAMLYKKHYQERIPSEGAGRRQRYRVGAVQVFRDLKKERMSKRVARRGKSTRQEPEADPSPLTLTSISKQTGISYPTLQRYVRLFGERIPSAGEGRKRRYHPSAVAVFRELRAQSKPGRKPKEEPPSPELLTLSAIGRLTGISGPTLQRYLKLHGEWIPCVGEGRKRRYYPQAVAVFQDLRSRSRRGPRARSTAGEAPAPPETAAPAVADPADDAPVLAEAEATTPDDAPEAAAPSVDDSGDDALATASAVDDSGDDAPEASARVVDDSGDDVPAVADSDGDVPAAAPPAVDESSGGDSGDEDTLVAAASGADAPAATAPAVLDSTDIEARLRALEDQVRLVLEKLEQPITITLNR